MRGPFWSRVRALYSEGLPGEIGLHTDPYAAFGRLNYDSLRCARLVVDTGLHHKQWTHDQALAYISENSALPRNEIENEVDRYIAWPGQALAYKIGELKTCERRPKSARASHSTCAPFTIACHRLVRCRSGCWSG